MTKRLLPCFLVVALLLNSGCLFSRKSRKPKENPAIATEVEKEFRQRWVTRRVGELTATGVPAATAQEQAEREFTEKYSFAVPAK